MGKRSRDILIKCGLPILAFLVIALTGKRLLGSDYAAFFQWWFTLFVIGIVFLPVSSLIFKNFHDGGFLFSKTIGIAVSGWVMWYLSSFHILKFTRVNTVISVGICAIFTAALMVGSIFYARKNKKEMPYQFDLNRIGGMLTAECLFFAAFTFWVYLKAFKPEAYGTEKFMDYGFMTTMMRAEYMPPQDLWMAGENINYYYVGQFLATYLTKLSGVTVGNGYNLMLMTIAAMGFALPYSIAYNVMKIFLLDRGLAKRNTGKPQFSQRFMKHKTAVATVSGVFAGLLVSIAGNLHYPIYRYIVPFFQKKNGEEVSSYWFPDATRYIGYNPETTDKTIHEFPCYSFVLGDLHAHVINIIFVLTVLGILFTYLLSRKKQMDALRMGESIEEPNFLKECFHPCILLIGFFIGLFHTTNFWDYPIYYVVSGAIILFSNLVIYQFKKKAVFLTAAHAVIILGIAKLVCLPFTLSFDQISTSISITQARTPIYQLAVLWGIPIFLVAMFVRVRYKDLKIEGFITDKDAMHGMKKKKKTTLEESGKVTFVPEKNKLFQFIDSLSVSDLFIATIGLCAVGLVFMPEVIYVVDIYIGDYKRANTMFKLTYQAYIMFGIAMSYITVRFITEERTKVRKAAGVFTAILLIWTMGYFGNATKAWFGDVKDGSRYKGIDASAFIQNENYDDYLATQWLNENVSGTPVVLEVNGDSYTYHERVSVITGLPTVLGWKTHEWLWRSDATGGYPPVLDERASDIQTIYTSEDVNAVKELIEKYDISYIYVGQLEAEQYEVPVNDELLRSLGEVVFESPATDTKTYTTYIVKINR